MGDSGKSSESTGSQIVEGNLSFTFAPKNKSKTCGLVSENLWFTPQKL